MGIELPQQKNQGPESPEQKIKSILNKLNLNLEYGKLAEQALETYQKTVDLSHPSSEDVEGMAGADFKKVTLHSLYNPPSLSFQKPKRADDIILVPKLIFEKGEQHAELPLFLHIMEKRDSDRLQDLAQSVWSGVDDEEKKILIREEINNLIKFETEEKKSLEDQVTSGRLTYENIKVAVNIINKHLARLNLFLKKLEQDGLVVEITDDGDLKVTIRTS
ncbi:MAG: hypothetical protein Q7R92_05725 [bacterium]|nr:hypothetical protein [bacterium]